MRCVVNARERAMLDNLATIGHNAPPQVAIETAKDVMADLGAFLKDVPVIEQMEQCKKGDDWIERTSIALATMEDERKPLVAPLNAQLKAINEPYRIVREPLERLYAEIKRRVSAFKNKVEAERKAEA